MSTLTRERPKETETPNDNVFVTLTLGNQLCGIQVTLVRDILGPQPITRIPLAPAGIAGSLNLRGRIVTAIDMKRRLGLPSTEPPAAQMSVVAEKGNELYALLVDQVSEVTTIDPALFEENPPTLGLAWQRFSRGIYRLEDGLLVVLDINRILDLNPGA